MCCFSAVSAPAGLLHRFFPPKPLRVAGTRIFARREGARELLAYAMHLEVAGDVAMILPLPVAPGHGEDAVRFIDLSGYPDLFVALETPFLAPQAKGPSRGRLLSIPAPAPLVVHEVGSYDASYVPSTADFDRLDPRFRLPTEVWEALPAVADFGFAVFKLGRGRRTVHPMAFSFPIREQGRLFFPTVHVHDGTVHTAADFDHVLYWQGPAPVADQTSGLPAGAFVDIEKSRGLVDGLAPLHRRALVGTLPNEDTWI